MAENEKIVERVLLLKQCFSKAKLFAIGRGLKIRYFERFSSGWDVDEGVAAFEVASNVNDNQLMDVFHNYAPWKWVIFRGKYYTYENGVLSLSGSWKMLENNINELKERYGKKGLLVLKTIAQIDKSCSLKEIKENLENTGHKIDPLPIVKDLERLKLIATSYSGKEYKEWKISEEVMPLIMLEFGEKPSTRTLQGVVPTKTEAAEVDYVQEERDNIKIMNDELDEYLVDLIKNRLQDTITFGKETSITFIAKYIQDLFGPVLYFDSLLSISQQYGLADAAITHEQGKTGMSTGFNLALFGEPGTGKTFSTRDMVLGRPEAKIPAHGIPGRNRYAGGISPARFIRIGQAYTGQTFNFIVPEFNDWFKYKGMVEPLKLAMERGEIKYELHRETIGPYRFNSFFSVNYNVAVYGRGYEVTVQDPNFNAIEDRTLCRLHRLTKSRFVEIAESQMRLALGEVDIDKGARRIRDHLTLIYAIETKHPLVEDRFKFKPVMITPEMYQKIGQAREAILERIPKEVVRFSARLEDRAVRLACAMSLPKYFQSKLDYIPISEDALDYAIRFYIEEASVRSSEEFNPEEILQQISY
ncbi:MAG TPA: hypothetical protein VED00_01515 [archaeon]|nr:hypothetical protein [archaeon]